MIKKNRWIIGLALLLLIFLGWFILRGIPGVMLHSLFSAKTYGPAEGPDIQFKNLIQFFSNRKNYERVTDIARDPNDIPPPIERREPVNISIEITAKEVLAEIAPGVTMNYWTFDGTVPGPFLRVRKGDTVTLTLTNDPTSVHHHSIDLHAVTGPGGGAAATKVGPGESKTIRFEALNPGIFVYHCAHPNVATHMAHGMYGLILVEPEEGLAKVEKEFYVMQGELYTAGPLGRKGLQLFDAKAMLESKPQYIVFNGRTGALANSLTSQVDDTVRMYVGNGGVNLTSNFHVIGEIFDRVFREGDLVSNPAESIQTTLVPAGGAAVVLFKTDYPGNYALVDHALARLDRGAWGILAVTGEARDEIFQGNLESGHGH